MYIVNKFRRTSPHGNPVLEEDKPGVYFYFFHALTPLNSI